MASADRSEFRAWPARGFCASPGRSSWRRSLQAISIGWLAVVCASGCAQLGGAESGGRDGGAEAAVIAADEDALQLGAPADPRDAALERLVAIEDIKQLKARFMRCIDTKDLVCLRDEVFAPGAEIVFVGADYDIRASGWTEIEKFYQGAFTAKKFGMHHAHTPEITVEGQTARGTWYLHDVFVNLEENWTLQGSALYEDDYAELDDGWRIMGTTYRRLWEETTPRDPKTKLGSKPIAD